MSGLGHIGLMAVLLGLSAFFSGSETALFSLDRLQLRRMQERGASGLRVLRLLDRPWRLLITILIGNMLVNTAASSVMTSLSIGAFGARGIALSIGVTTFLLLLFGEITPKTIAINHAERVALAVARPLGWFAHAVFPLRIALRKISDLHVTLIGGKVKPLPTLTQDELRTVIDVGHQEGTLGSAEREMLHSVLAFGRTTVADVMTPRVDIKAAPRDASQSQLLEFARATRHSKLPIFEGSVDHIVGVVYAKELFWEPERPFQEVMHPPVFVPTSKGVDELLFELEARKEDVVVVLDEYGGTEGLVTVEDILEEIFGEIHDEFETMAAPIERLASGRHRVHGGVTIQELNRQLGLHLPEEGSAQTLAGYLMGAFGHIPWEGEHVAQADALFYVERMRRHRILYVLVETQ